MDLEGAEYEALKGAQKNIEKFKPKIFLEILTIENAVNCFAFLAKFGYRFSVLNFYPFNPKNRFKNQNDIFQQKNEFYLYVTADEEEVLPGIEVSREEDLRNAFQHLKTNAPKESFRRNCLNLWQNRHNEIRRLLVVPFYKNEDLVRQITDSILEIKDEILKYQFEIVFVNDSPDYLPLAEALDYHQRRLKGLSHRLITNPQNLGYLSACNVILEEFQDGSRDILFLNSDARILPGALQEVCEVAEIDPRFGFIAPRSDFATICTIRNEGGRFDTFDIHRHVKNRLKKYSVVPVVTGFCIYIKGAVIRDFGPFDPVFGSGYEEENDMILRAGVGGWRAVMANRGFVRHSGSVSFGDAADEKKSANFEVLVNRHPYYNQLNHEHYRGEEFAAEQLVLASESKTFYFLHHI